MSKSTIDPHKIFIHADSFRNSVEMLFAESGSFDARDKAMPAIVNTAFAVELYLKCLLSLETGDFPRGHNLKDLFAGLSSRSHDTIVAGYKHLLNQEPAAARNAEIYAQRIGELTTARGEHPIDFSGTDIDSVLDDCKNAFQQFRYSFEPSNQHRHVNLTLLDAVLFSTREVIVKLKPEWLDTYVRSSASATTIININDNFKRFLGRQSPDMDYGDVNFGCASGLHGFKIGFTLVPDKYGVFPHIKEGRTIIIWPKDDMFVCPGCGAKSDIKLMREYIEQYTGKKVQQVL